MNAAILNSMTPKINTQHLNEQSAVTLDEHGTLKYQTPSIKSKPSPRRVGTQGALVSPHSNQQIVADSRRSKGKSKKSIGSDAPSRVFKVEQDIYIFEDNQYI